MEKEFVPYELALRMKELGFDEPCFTFYSSKGVLQTGILDILRGFIPEDLNKGILAPTFSQAFRWFRENYGLDSSVEREKVKVGGKWVKSKFYVYTIENDDDFPLSLGFDLKDDAIYEEAELACLEKLISIVE